MDIPNIAPPGPGGPLVTAMGGINSLANDMLLRKINEVRARYAPLATEAEINSKNAYARLVGLQPLSKLLQNDPAFQQLSPEDKQGVVDRFLQAGMGHGMTGNGNSNGNALTSLPGGQAPNQNTLFNPPNFAPAGTQNTPAGVPGDNEALEPGADPVAYADQNNIHSPNYNPGQNADYNVTAGRGKGIQNQEAELGKYRAQDIHDIGQQQLALSNAGVSLDRMIGIVKNPEFQALRSTIPFFQDKQLGYLSKTGDKRQQDLIGDFISTSQSMLGDAVNSFQGKAMQREFDYAQKLKINENDTVGVAEGKLRALKTLKEIGQYKNDIITNLMEDKHMNLAQAVKVANKQLPIKAIEEKVNQLLEKRVTIRNKNGETRTISESEAKRLVEGK